MNYYGWKPYVPVAARRAKAAKAAAKASKSGAALSPVSASRGAIAKTFWGRAWCENLERYSDYANRLPRGRTYVRNGSVIDLQIGAGEVRAQVVGSSLYQVTIGVAAVPGAQWQAISAECAASIDTLVELLQGKLSTAVMERICKPGTGLFPAPREIKLSCSCPDWAEMCKHVAAVMYGVGARVDLQPELLFRLRRVDPKDLVAQAGTAIPKAGKVPVAGKVLDESQLADVFGIEIDEGVAPKRGAKQRKAPAKVKSQAPAKVAIPATVGARSKVGARAKLGAAGKAEAPSAVRARVKGAATVKVGKAVKVGATAKTAASTSKAATAKRKSPPAKRTPAKASATKTAMPAKKPRASGRK